MKSKTAALIVALILIFSAALSSKATRDTPDRENTTIGGDDDLSDTLFGIAIGSDLLKFHARIAITVKSQNEP